MSPYTSGRVSLELRGVGVTNISIPNQAFYDCASLTSVTIPDSVTSIGNNAFYGCTNLTSVIFDDPTNWYTDDAFTTQATIGTPAENATQLKSGTIGALYKNPTP